MNHLDQNISKNLKRIRKGRNMSLDMLAEQTGVSKSMLGQIERGESNPTVTTIGKIVEGLRVPFEELIEIPKREVAIVEKKALTTFRNINDRYRVYVIWPFEKGCNFEVYSMEVLPGGVYEAGSHGEDTFEYVTVYSGTLQLEMDGKVYQIEAGNSVRFASDKKHRYENISTSVMNANVVLSFNRGDMPIL